MGTERMISGLTPSSKERGITDDQDWFPMKINISNDYSTIFLRSQVPKLSTNAAHKQVTGLLH